MSDMTHCNFDKEEVHDKTVANGYCINREYDIFVKEFTW
jgi:hypothetical protein